MNSRQRVLAALAGEPVDRPPISFWGHFYHRESSAAELVAATLEFQSRHEWDWVKLNPRKHYHVEPWGVRYRYPGVPNVKPALDAWPIRTGDDWRAVGEVAHDGGPLGEQIEAVRSLRRSLPADVPMIETVFTPLAVLGEMTGTPDDLVAHLRSHPHEVRAALAAVTATFKRFVRSVLDAGADGIYFATVDWASRERLSEAEYREWARPWDLELIRAAFGAPFNVLHVCRGHNLLFECADYPVHAFSWATTDPTNPSLAAARSRLGGAVMGGIAHDGVLDRDDTAAAIAQLRDAWGATSGRRWLAAPGCSIPPSACAATLDAVKASLEGAPHV